MTDTSRIDDLRRRVREDPASIAFAQLAEECRRAGLYEEAVEVCRAGLSRHPGYHSARVTLGRALAHLGLVDDARLEFRTVLGHAPENLAALRGLAEIYYHQGALPEAMTQYKAALILAPNDPDLERSIFEISQALTRTTNMHDRRRGEQTITALERWVAAIHVTRTEQRA
jgi:tetratricopeptide (TPR) repeat protein